MAVTSPTPCDGCTALSPTLKRGVGVSESGGGMYPLGMAGRCTGFGGAGGATAAATGSGGGVSGRFRRALGERGGAAAPRLGATTTRAVEPERMGRVIDLGEPEASRVG